MKTLRKAFVLYPYTADSTLYDASESYPTVDRTINCEPIYFTKMTSRLGFKTGEYSVHLREPYRQKYIKCKVIIEYDKPFIKMAIKDVDLKDNTVYNFELLIDGMIYYKGVLLYSTKNLQIFNFTNLKEVKNYEEYPIQNTTEFKKCKKQKL